MHYLALHRTCKGSSIAIFIREASEAADTRTNSFNEVPAAARIAGLAGQLPTIHH